MVYIYNVVREIYSLNMPGYFKNIILRLFFLLIPFNVAFSQFFSNPSFEDVPGLYGEPIGWFGCYTGSSPDRQPGYSDVGLLPSDGISYIGMRTRGEIPDTFGNSVPYSAEDAHTILLNPLLKDYCYLFSIDLAFDSMVLLQQLPIKTYPTKLRIWGGNSRCDTSELLGETEMVENTTWKTFTMNISPKYGSYEYFSIEPWWVGDSMYHGMLLADNIQITEIFPAPEVKLDTAVLQGETVTLSASDNDSYIWSPQNNTLSCFDCQSPTAIIYNTQIYYVTLKYNRQCALREKFIVSILDCDKVWEERSQTILDTMIAIGDTIGLSASDEYSYQWNTTDLNGCDTCQDFLYYPGQTDSISVIVSDKYDCLFEEKFIIRLPDCEQRKLENSYVKVDTDILPNIPYTIHASNSDEYAWDFNEALSCLTCPSPSITLSEPDSFTVTLLDEYNCEYNEFFIIRMQDCEIIGKEDNPNKINVTIDPWENIVLEASPSDKYIWDPILGLSCDNCQNPVLSTDKKQTYIVSLTDQYGCDYKEYFHVSIRIQFPNVITPNNDGRNDFFTILGLPDYNSLTIFDRNGKIVFKTKNYQNNFNGISKDGDILQQDTYWYSFIDEMNFSTYSGYVFIKRY